MTRERSFPGAGHRYDLIVVGAGISGAELAYAAAAAGCDTLLVTTSLDSVCTLFGEGAVLAPPAGSLLADLHRRASAGDGFVGSWELHRVAKQALEERSGLHLLQSNVTALVLADGRVAGVETWEGVRRHAGRVALCVGSFLEGRLTVGKVTEEAGRLGEMSYDDLYHDLSGHGFVFEPCEQRVDAGAGRLPYAVRCRVFRPQELGPQGALSRIPGLYAAGLCAAGYLTYEAAAAAGRAVGLALAAECRG